MSSYKNSDNQTIEAVQIKTEQTIQLKNMIITGFPDSWLITPPDREQFFVSDQVFKKKYELVETSN